MPQIFFEDVSITTVTPKLFEIIALIGNDENECV